MQSIIFVAWLFCGYCKYSSFCDSDVWEAVANGWLPLWKHFPILLSPPAPRWKLQPLFHIPPCFFQNWALSSGFCVAKYHSFCFLGSPYSWREVREDFVVFYCWSSIFLCWNGRKRCPEDHHPKYGLAWSEKVNVESAEEFQLRLMAKWESAKLTCGVCLLKLPGCRGEKKREICCV